MHLIQLESKIDSYVSLEGILTKSNSQDHKIVDQGQKNLPCWGKEVIVVLKMEVSEPC